jgi:hypothetical protein
VATGKKTTLLWGKPCFDVLEIELGKSFMLSFVDER